MSTLQSLVLFGIDGTGERGYNGDKTRTEKTEEARSVKEYEIVLTYLNGCAGEAYPMTSFDEAELADPQDYIRGKHPVDHNKFVREETDAGQVRYTFDNGTVRYIYEFTEL